MALQRPDFRGEMLWPDGQPQLWLKKQLVHVPTCLYWEVSHHGSCCTMVPQALLVGLPLAWAGPL